MTDTEHAQLETWKRKYYDSVEQAETRERRWAGMEELLRKTITRLSLAADGLDTTLDHQLAELRNAIRDRADDRTLQQRIEAMSATLVRLDTDRAGAARTRGAVESLQSLLEQTRFPRGNAHRLKTLHKQLDALEDAEAARAVDRVAALLNELLAVPLQQASTPARGLRRWFSGRSRPEAAADAGASDPGAAGPAPSQERKTEPGPGAAGRELLLQLLEQLGLPEAFDARIEALQQRLEEDSDCHMLVALHEITDMVAEMRVQLQREKQEIEAFLQQLTDRLQDVDSLVKGAEGERRAAYEQGRVLGDAVQAQVRGIESDVQDVQELSQLKQTVQARIDAIVEHVEQHRQAETARNQAADARVQTLQQRLRDLEGETAELRERVRQQRSQALTDTLTGIPNRLAWDERVQQECARWKRFQTPLALLVWDVDNFKPINDEYGHKAGDKVLRVIAGLLADNIRETDFIARFGGEEFAMLVTGSGVGDVSRVAEKLRAAIEGCGFHYRGRDVCITISCGIALFADGDSIEAVFERADRALYRAKEQGRNRCVLAEAIDGG
ncbi:MAG TPA: diguanylate cyclase [Thiohalobacter sp.]|nr:diguanylate cyclase [Thiohalobacter sp.]